MRAAVLRECPGWLDVSDISIDAPKGREVLIRTAAAGLCHSDLHCIHGKFPTPVPSVLGHESAGIVEAVGPDVTYAKVGDRVITCLSAFCGICEYCVTGRPQLCQARELRRNRKEAPRLSENGVPVRQFSDLGSFAEQMLVHENTLVKVPDAMPLDRAALVSCGVTTGLGAVLYRAQVPAGATVAVIGCGGIGLSAVQGARLAGAARVIAVDVLDTKLDLARSFGATDTVNAASDDPVAAVLELTGGGVEYSFEAIGAVATSEQAFRMLRPGGTATIIGVLPAGAKLGLTGLELLTERRVQGSLMGSHSFRDAMPRYIDLYLQGRLKLDELISARITLDDVNDGYKRLETGDVARSVIVFDGVPLA
ncbi:MAG: Zn-dependent alcohol dehydrogenase [Acidimicrobiia bacterium]